MNARRPLTAICTKYKTFLTVDKVYEISEIKGCSYKVKNDEGLDWWYSNKYLSILYPPEQKVMEEDMKRGSIVICIDEERCENLTLYEEYEVLFYDKNFELVCVRNDVGEIVAYHKEIFVFKEEEEDNMKEEEFETCLDNDNMVDHPSHYNMGKYEVINVIDDWKLGFSLGNAVKYIARAGHKWNAVEDLKKAIFYIQHEIDRLEKEEE